MRSLRSYFSDYSIYYDIFVSTHWQYAPEDVEVVLVGNKVDLVESRAISKEAGEEVVYYFSLISRYANY